MTEPKYKVGQEVWFFGWNGKIFRDKIRHVEGDECWVVYHSCSIEVESLFPTAAALLENIKTQIKELEK